jgi:Domain of unknown function DUF29
MNKMVSINRSTSPDYDADGYGWAMAQGALIRAGQHSRVDWEHVAEEIETMGRSERSTLESNLTQILVHMLKWDVQTGKRSRSWYVSIAKHRIAALKVLRQNPSLKPMLEVIIEDALADAKKLAALETGLKPERFEACSYSRIDVFDRPYAWPLRSR